MRLAEPPEPVKRQRAHGRAERVPEHVVDVGGPHLVRERLGDLHGRARERGDQQDPPHAEAEPPAKAEPDRGVEHEVRYQVRPAQEPAVGTHEIRDERQHRDEVDGHVLRDSASRLGPRAGSPARPCPPPRRRSARARLPCDVDRGRRLRDGGRRVSVAGLVFGVAASTSDSQIVLLAGATGAVAGAVSMMAGTYLDVHSERSRAAALVDRARARSPWIRPRARTGGNRLRDDPGAGGSDLVRWMVGLMHASAEQAGRDPASIQVQAAAPAHVGPIEECRERVRWFPAAVSGHVADLVNRYRATSCPIR